MQAAFTAFQTTTCEKDVKVAHAELGDPGTC